MAKIELKKLLTKKRLIIAGIVLVIAAIIIAIVLNIQQQSARHGNLKAPEYQTILPNGKSIDELGGWTRVSPPDSDPVFAYADKIDDVAIGVSEQPLPESFKVAAAYRVAELAKKFNATARIEAGDTPVYIGTSAKGPQSIIFTKNDLLILVKSQNKIEDDAWATYVKSLQ